MECADHEDDCPTDVELTDKIWALTVEAGLPLGEPWLVGETGGSGVDGRPPFAVARSW